MRRVRPFLGPARCGTGVAVYKYCVHKYRSGILVLDPRRVVLLYGVLPAVQGLLLCRYIDIEANWTPGVKEHASRMLYCTIQSVHKAQNLGRNSIIKHGTLRSESDRASDWRAPPQIEVKHPSQLVQVIPYKGNHTAGRVAASSPLSSTSAAHSRNLPLLSPPHISILRWRLDSSPLFLSEFPSREVQIWRVAAEHYMATK